MRGAVLVFLLAFCTATALGQSSGDYITAYPNRGEGVQSFLRRNGLRVTTGIVDQFQLINRGRFLRGGGLRRDVAYRLPHADNIVRYPIFGPAYESVKITSDKLKGCVYYVVSGHGGPDPGTTGRYKGRVIAEDEVAYDTALRIARLLIEEGADVYMIVQDTDGIRDTDRLESDKDEVHLGGGRISSSQVRRLRDRTRIINTYYDQNRRKARLQRVVEVHVDATGRDRKSQIDVHFAFASPGGRRLSDILLTTFREQYEKVQPGRGYKGKIASRNFHMLRETKPVAVLIELGDIRFPGDQARFMQYDNRQILAEWIVKGLERDAATIKS